MPQPRGHIFRLLETRRGAGIDSRNLPKQQADQGFFGECAQLRRGDFELARLASRRKKRARHDHGSAAWRRYDRLCGQSLKAIALRKRQLHL